MSEPTGGMSAKVSPSPIHEQMNYLDERAERLDKLLAILKEKLTPVLAPDSPSEKKPPAKERVTPGSTIGISIKDAGGRLDSFCERIECMVTNLEI